MSTCARRTRHLRSCCLNINMTRNCSQNIQKSLNLSSIGKYIYKSKYLSNIFYTRHQKDAHLNIPCGCSTSALLTALTAIFTFIEYQFVFSNHFPCFLVSDLYTYVKSVLLKEQSMYTNLIIGLNRTVMKHQKSSKNG